MLCSKNHELDIQLCRVEEKVRDKIPSTLRGIGELAEDLGFTGRKSFIEYISGKYVLDVGSGLNGLAIEALLENVPTSIISINPQIDPMIGRYDFEAVQKRKIKAAGFLLFKYDEEAVWEACRLANSRTFPYFAHNFGFLDSSYDRVIDSTAVFFNFRKSESLAFMETVMEMFRVCRGSIRISDRSTGVVYGGAVSNWKENMLKKMGLDFEPHKYGVEIFKLPYHLRGVKLNL